MGFETQLSCSWKDMIEIPVEQEREIYGFEDKENLQFLFDTELSKTDRIYTECVKNHNINPDNFDSYSKFITSLFHCICQKLNNMSAYNSTQINWLNYSLNGSIPESYQSWSNLSIGLIFILPVITVIGNLMVVLSVAIEKTLQLSPSNAFIVSLALADISGNNNFYSLAFK